MMTRTEYVVKYRSGSYVISRFSEDWESAVRFVRNFLNARGIYNYTIQKIQSLVF